jgi:hypothetical protein
MLGNQSKRKKPSAIETSEIQNDPTARQVLEGERLSFP